MDKISLMHEIEKSKIIAIMRRLSMDNLEGVVEALISAGISIIEFPIDHNRKDCLREACEKIAYVAERYGERVCVGAGTVLSVEEVRETQAAGASLIVSPNTDPDVIRHTKDDGLLSIPGAMTATECVTAYNAGADYVKLFPGAELGVAYVKALMAPLGHIPFLLMGGITHDNIKNYLNLGVRGFGIGSTILPEDALRRKDYMTVKLMAERYIGLIGQR